MSEQTRTVSGITIDALAHGVLKGVARESEELGFFSHRDFADTLVERLHDRGYAIIKVGSVPEWMEPAAAYWYGEPREIIPWSELMSDEGTVYEGHRPILYALRSSDGAP